MRRFMIYDLYIYADKKREKDAVMFVLDDVSPSFNFHTC